MKENNLTTAEILALAHSVTARDGALDSYLIPSELREKAAAWQSQISEHDVPDLLAEAEAFEDYQLGEIDLRTAIRWAAAERHAQSWMDELDEIESNERAARLTEVASPGSGPLQTFLVISYDDDEQRAFYDIIAAPNDGIAGNQVDDARGEYASVIDILDARQLAEFSRLLAEANSTPTA